MQSKKRGGLPAGVLAWVYIMRLYARVTREAERELKKSGLSLSRFDVLAQMEALDQPCTQDYLRQRLMVTKGNISALIDRLVADGLVKRDPEPGNRRANRLELTATGRKVARKEIPQHEMWLRNLYRGFSAKEQAVLRDLLRRALGNAGRL